MKIDILPLGHIASNCYMLTTEKAAVIIDPGFISEKTEDFLERNSDKERLIFLTHGHFDHICGAKSLRDKTGVKIAIPVGDNPALSDTHLSMSDKFHAHQVPFSADILLEDSQIVKVGDLEFKVISTPGHTAGGACYYVDNVLFSGDTLFFESVGRTDFKGADHATLLNSINKLLALPDETVVYPGHGRSTTIGHERICNPFLQNL